MIELKAALFDLCPMSEQAAQMRRISGACRFACTLALKPRRDRYRPGRKFRFTNLRREVPLLRAEVEWRKTAPVHALQQALRNLDRAYQAWWAGCDHDDAASRPSQAAFVCVRCAHRANAGANAAINILRRAGSALKAVEGHPTWRPDEAGASRRTA